MSIVKIAQARWRQFLSLAKDGKDLGERASKLLVNSPGLGNHRFYRVADEVKKVKRFVYRNEGTLTDSIKDAKKIISQGHKLSSAASNPIHGIVNLNKVNTDQARGYARNDMKKILDAKRGNDIRKPFGGEEYHDIFHGGEINAIKAKLQGNSPYPMEANALVGNKIESSGIQVHTKPNNRLEIYAQRAAGEKLSQPAILQGRIKGKYLFHNNSFSGGGDEYGIPHSFLKHIESPKIVNVKEDLSHATTF